MYKTLHHPIFKIITWLNIFIMSFIQVLAFVSVADAAKRSGVEYSRQQVETTVYFVSYGETAEIIAAKFNISVSVLRSLNTRTFFKKDFDHLQKGDVLVVPARVVAKNGAITDPKVAGYLNEAATFLNNGGTSSDLADNIEAQARSFFIGNTIGRANSSLEQWLNQYGTARVQLDVDEHFSLKNSQFDLLLPLWERKNHLLFTQGSFHRTDDRNQTNLGFGYRYFTTDYMIGGNAFFDYDLSRSHSRMGLGLEYSRDYFRLGVNSYIRLSEWRDSRDFDNYEERPANGWDTRVEAYLPSHPQLGFKLSWEQYYGDEVALFGKNSRQHSPYAVTFGANYTPFPLMTLSAEHRKGTSGKNDTRFGVQMTYRMDVPLRDQLDPGAVDGLRKLGGGRYDFVERNNNIILEYREKKGIKLAMRHEITGFAYEDHSLEMTVESKAGVARIDVSAPELVAAGGRIISGGMDPSGYRVVLPPYHNGGDTANTYTITAIAYDAKNRASNQETTRVVIGNVPVNAEQSLFKADPPTVVIGKTGADNKTHLTFTAFDGQGNPVSGLAADNKLEFVVEEMVSVQAENGVAATAGKITETETGVYEADLTGTKVGSYKVTPKADGVLLGGIMLVVAFANEGADVAVDGDDRSTFKAEPETIYVEGIEGAVQVSKLKFKAVDAFNNPIPGLVAKGLTFAVADPADAVPGKAFTIGLVGETGKGIYEAEFRARMAAGYKIEPRLGGTPVHAQLFAKVAALADNATSAGPDEGGADASFTASPAQIDADGVAKSTLTFKARDKNNNAIGGAAGQITFVSDKKTVTISAVTESAKGTYVAELSGTVADVYTIVPQFASAAVGKLSAVVTLTADNATPAGPDEGGASLFRVDPAIIAANDTEVATFTFEARDQYGNPVGKLVENKKLAFVLKPDAGSDAQGYTMSEIMEKADGIYTATVKGTKGGKYTFVPAYDGKQMAGLEQTVELVGDIGTASMTLNLNGAETKLPANETDKFTFTATITDAHGNPVPYARITWDSNLPDAGIFSEAVSTTDENGQATVDLVSKMNVAGNDIQVSGVLDKDGTSVRIDADKVVSFIGYTFEATLGLDLIAVGGKVQAQVMAIGSDATRTDLTATTTWASGDTTKATVNTTGFVTGKGDTGATPVVIGAAGVYQGISYGGELKLTVRTVTESKLYGSLINSVMRKPAFLNPTSYQLAGYIDRNVQSQELYDLGTLEYINKTYPSNADSRVHLLDTKEITSIVIYWKRQTVNIANGRQICAMEVKYRNGISRMMGATKTITSCGEFSESFVMPTGAILYGIGTAYFYRKNIVTRELLVALKFYTIVP